MLAREIKHIRMLFIANNTNVMEHSGNLLKALKTVLLFDTVCKFIDFNN